MGAANVIPGVSGGTIALVTGIYIEFINSLKCLDLKAVKLLFSFRWKLLAEHINFKFLLSISIGVAASLFSIAKLFEYLFAEHPILIWSFFFGLILASVYFVGKTVTRWNVVNILWLILGVVIAVGISMFKPASANDNLLYVGLCGIIGISGMMLPGLSGSFILILMGNYELLMVESISNLNWVLLVVFALGSIIGMVSFSHVLSWILKRYFNATIALLTGFVFGSLNIIWPWKEVVETYVKPSGEIVPLKYEKILPPEFDAYTLLAIGLILFGIFSIWLIEYLAKEE